MFSLRVARTAVATGGKVSTSQLGLGTGLVARQAVGINAFRAGNAVMQRRLAATTTASSSTEPTTESTTASQANELLRQQRLKRPLSPHLSIYKPQLTWYPSALNRITGSIVSGGVYLFFGLYLIAPYLGLHMESAAIAASFGALPVAAKVGLKAAMAFPFTFHSFNGVRHLVWDTGRQMSIPGVYRTIYIVLGLTAVSTVGLALY